jgi:hypothetical protein
MIRKTDLTMQKTNRMSGRLREQKEVHENKCQLSRHLPLHLKLVYRLDQHYRGQEVMER